MSRAEQLKKQIAELDPDELRVLGEWFERYNAGVWYRRLPARVQRAADKTFELLKADP